VPLFCRDTLRILLVRLLATVLIFIPLVLFLTSSFAQSMDHPYTNPKNDTERFVIASVKRGDAADLSVLRGSQRTLTPEFVEGLLTGSYFSTWDARRGVAISNAIFDKPLIISAETVQVRTIFLHCIFNAGLDFGGSEFSQDLSFEGSHFLKGSSVKSNDAEVSVALIGTKVDGTLTLNGAEFMVPANFTNAEVRNGFEATHTKFLCAEVDFENFKAEKRGVFQSTWFDSTPYLAYARFSDLSLQGLIFTPSALKENENNVDLTQVKVERELIISDMRLRDLLAPYLTVGGPTTFEDVTIDSRADLSHDHFQTVTIGGWRPWLCIPSVSLEGIIFDDVDVKDANTYPRSLALLSLINSSHVQFAPQPYLELESTLRAHGRPDNADDVYIAMRTRRRKEMSIFDPAWPGDWLIYKLVGYGRKPWRAIGWSLLFILAGTFTFRRKFMVPVKDQDSTENMSTGNETNGSIWNKRRQTALRSEANFNPFWYSVDLFAPVIDLGSAKEWTPKTHERWVWRYFYFHRLAGWVLIPIILAAITGIIK
jgi:hypothetical protein